jgi:hypothetical protein
VRELRGSNPSFSSSSPASSSTSPAAHQGGSLGARQRSTDSALSSSGGGSAGGGAAESGANEDILRWHRNHLAELTRLVDEELKLLEKHDRGEIKGARYRAALNDVLIDEAMLFRDMPKNLE